MSDAVRRYYDQNAAREWDRLATGGMRLEWVTTWRLIERYFPARGVVLDIGGGPGRYTLELKRRGYDVTLIELSHEQATLAADRIHEAGLHAGIICADAREVLPVLKDASTDAALLLGPMYHLTDQKERAQVLRDTARILRPGGVAIIAYLNSLGVVRAGVVDFPSRFEDLDDVRGMLRGRTFSDGELPGFTDCYWATPETALAEVHASGLDVVTRAGAEGFASGLRTVLDRLAIEKPHAYENICTLAADTSEHPAYRDCTEHLHIVARKPGKTA